MALNENWQKPSASGNGASCMIVRTNGDSIQVADDKNHPNQGGPVLTFTKAEWDAAQDAFSRGEFDL